MISAVAILMLCNGIRMSPRSEKNTINEIGCVMEFMTHLFRFFIFSFLHFFVSSFFRFFIFSFLHFFHRISRMNRRHSCLSDFSRNFADIWPLANGSRPIYAPVVFVTQISQMAQIFLRGDYFVPQISQIYTDFSLWGIISSHRFHRYTQIFLRGDYFVPQISQIYTDFSLWDIFHSQLVSAPTE